jgi:hypothetical protein
MEEHVLEVVSNALALAGYNVLDGDRECVIIRHSESDTDYKVTIEEEPC